MSWGLWSALRAGTDFLLPQHQEDGDAGAPFGSAFGGMPGMPPMAQTMDRNDPQQQQQQNDAFASTGHRLGKGGGKSASAGSSCCAGRDRGDDSASSSTAAATASPAAGGSAAAPAAASPADAAQRAQERDARAQAAMARINGGSSTVTITKP